MFTGLMNFFASLWTGFVKLIQGIWDYAKAGYVWLVGILVAALGLVTTFVQWAADRVGEMATAVGNIVMPNEHVTQSVSDSLAVVNHFFALQEAFVLAIALSTLWILMLGLRFVKWVREVVLP
jgi:hypothetical protein